MRKIWPILLAVFCASCSTTPPEAHRWTKAELSNADLSLIDDRVVLQMGFDEKVEGAGVTMGLVGGPLTPPLFYARINNRGVLILSDGEGRTVFEITKLYDKGKRIGVAIHKGVDIIGVDWDEKVWVLERQTQGQKGDTEPTAAAAASHGP